MQAAEHLKQFVGVLHVEPHAVVLDEVYHFVSVRASADAYLRSGTSTAELERVPEQVRQHLPDQRLVPDCGGERLDRDGRRPTFPPPLPPPHNPPGGGGPVDPPP